jgi:heme-degrading monooxygenase HmoA
MFARVNTFEGDTGAVRGAVREIVWPAIREIDGFRGYLVLVSPDEDRAVGVTLWESEEAEVASRASAEEIRPRLQDATGGRVVKVEAYEVALFESPPARMGP